MVVALASSFTARRSQPELVAPARPTPRDTKLLSDVDDYTPNRYYYPWVEFFQQRDLAVVEPAEAIRAALAKALVLYYPVAGRLREVASGKLVVDCTGEGVVFVEADADVRLQDLGQPLVPPYPCVEELFCDAGDTRDVVAKPIVFLQVTRFKCGGFAIGFQMVHSIADGCGMIQFMKAVADLAGGKELPEVVPVWERELLMARPPPNIALVASKFGSAAITKRNTMHATTPPPLELGDHGHGRNNFRMESQYFIFGPQEISTLRRHCVSGDDDDDHDLRRSPCTTFELLTAVIWRCRTAAFGYAAGERSRFAFTANFRRKIPQIPRGYYGNAVVIHVVDADAGELCSETLGHTVRLIRAAKSETTEEYVRSTIDYVALLRAAAAAPLPSSSYDEKTYYVSDVTSLGEDKLDFGWAEWVAGGRATPSMMASNHRKCKNSDGEDAVAVSMVLPKPAMDRFRKEMAAWLMKQDA